MKVLACSLILRLSSVWFQFYVIGDLIMFFCYKILRGDFRYWLNLPGLLSWVASALIRAVIKVIVDFTLIVHFRHPYDIGGMYWSCNVVLNQLFCFASVYLYKEHLNAAISDNTNYRDGSEGDFNVSPRCNPTDYTSYNVDFVCEESSLEASLWYLVFGLFVLSMLSFGGFLLSINRDYWVTFFDTRTGREFICDLWRDEATDKERFYVFSKHPSYYDDIAEELKKWLTDNWDIWEERKPDWFTAKMIGKIPSKILPGKVREKLGSNKKDRKKSIVAMIKDEETEDAKRMSIMVKVNEVVPDN